MQRIRTVIAPGPRLDPSENTPLKIELLNPILMYLRTEMQVGEGSVEDNELTEHVSKLATQSLSFALNKEVLYTDRTLSEDRTLTGRHRQVEHACKWLSCHGADGMHRQVRQDLSKGHILLSIGDVEFTIEARSEDLAEHLSSFEQALSQNEGLQKPKRSLVSLGDTQFTVMEGRAGMRGTVLEVLEMRRNGAGKQQNEPETLEARVMRLYDLGVRDAYLERQTRTTAS